MRKYFYTAIFFIASLLNGFGQKDEKIELSPQMKEAIKTMLKDFIKESPKHDGADDVYAHPFMLITGKISDEAVQSALKVFTDSLKLDQYASQYFYSDTDGNDFDFITIEVNGQFFGPAELFRTGDPVKNGLRGYDSLGKSLMGRDDDILKFSQFKNYPYATINEYDGKFNEMLLLKQEPKGKVTVRGTMLFTYPSEIMAMEFTKADIGVTKELNGVKGTLLKIENGNFIMKMEGSTDAFKKVALNKDGYRFNGIYSSSMDVSLYEKALNRGAASDSTQLDVIMNEYQPTMDRNTPMAYRYTVPGELSKLVFYMSGDQWIEKEYFVELK